MFLFFLKKKSLKGTPHNRCNLSLRQKDKKVDGLFYFRIPFYTKCSVTSQNGANKCCTWESNNKLKFLFIYLITYLNFN